MALNVLMLYTSLGPECLNAFYQSWGLLRPSLEDLLFAGPPLGTLSLLEDRILMLVAGIVILIFGGCVVCWLSIWDAEHGCLSAVVLLLGSCRISTQSTESIHLAWFAAPFTHITAESAPIVLLRVPLISLHFPLVYAVVRLSRSMRASLPPNPFEFKTFCYFWLNKAMPESKVLLCMVAYM